MIARPLRRERLLLVLAAGVLVPVLLALVLFLPLLREAGAARRDARAKVDELVRMTALAQQRAEIERRHAEVRQAAESLVALIPPEPDLPDLILHLDGAIGASRVVLLDISFPGETPGTGGSQGAPANVGFQPVQMRVLGTYPQVRALTVHLERLPRLVVIDRVTLTGTDAGIVAEVALRALFLR